MKQISFFVPGTPVPKGSAKAFVNKYTGRAQVMQDNRDKQKPWASDIAYHASQEYKGAPFTGPVKIGLHFVMPRLKGHFGTGKNSETLKPGAPIWHISKPDLDKLIRCVKDALTGVIWKDDSQVCKIGETTKQYGERPGVFISVCAIDPL